MTDGASATASISLPLRTMIAMDHHIVTIKQGLQDHAHCNHYTVVQCAAAQLTVVGDVEQHGLHPPWYSMVKSAQLTSQPTCAAAASSLSVTQMLPKPAPKVKTLSLAMWVRT